IHAYRIDRSSSNLFSARRGVAPGQRRHANCEDQNSPLKYRLKVRGRTQNGEAIEPDRQDKHADERAHDMKLTFTQRCRAQEDRGKSIEQIAVADAERSAPQEG